MDIERLRMVKDRILKYPDEADMRKLHSRDGCHCIFGQAQVMFSPRFLDRFWRGKFANNPRHEEEVFAYLGMSYMEARRLYILALWPKDLTEMYRKATTGQGRAEAMAAAIERFIADPGFREDRSKADFESIFAQLA